MRDQRVTAQACLALVEEAFGGAEAEGWDEAGVVDVLDGFVAAIAGAAEHGGGANRIFRSLEAGAQVGVRIA